MKTYIKKILVLCAFVPMFAFAETAVTTMSTDVLPDQIDCAAITHNLKLGSKDGNTGGDVTTLQTYLSQANFLDSDPTGYLGRATKKAVQDFQKANDITPTGSVGPYTRAKIKELSCKNTSSNTDTTNTQVSDTTRVKSQTPPSVKPYLGQTGEVTPTTSNLSLYVYPESGQAPLTVMIKAPQDVMNKIEKCVYSVGWYGASGNGLQVDWGDGTNVFDASSNVTGTSCTSAVGKHTYNNEGTYIIKVKSWHPGPSDGPVTDWEGKTYVKVVKSPISTGTTGSTVPTNDAPKVDLKINGSDDALVLDSAREVKLSWMTSGVNDCQIMVAGVASTAVPTSGSQATTLNPSWTSYVSLTCKRGNNGETVSDYVKVLKQTSPTPQPVATETKTPPVTPTNTTSAALGVKVISPNGGETYPLEGDMKVYWSVSGMPSGGTFLVKLIGEGKEIKLVSTNQDIGTETTRTASYSLSSKNGIFPGSYKVRIVLMGTIGEFLATDISDDFIKITPNTTTSSTGQN